MTENRNSSCSTLARLFPMVAPDCSSTLGRSRAKALAVVFSSSTLKDHKRPSLMPRYKKKSTALLRTPGARFNTQVLTVASSPHLRHAPCCGHLRKGGRVLVQCPIPEPTPGLQSIGWPFIIPISNTERRCEERATTKICPPCRPYFSSHLSTWPMTLLFTLRHGRFSNV